MDRQEKINLIYRTHQIYTGIKGKDIVLLTANPPGRTDCETFISIPIEDPDADIIHKHEWMHIFFKSNLRARAAFVDAYIANLKKRVMVQDEPRLESFLHMLINGLDDLRVCSLWGLIYPRSSEQVAGRWSQIIVNSRRYRHDLVMYMMGLGLGIEAEMAEGSEWGRYREVLLDAVQKVHLRGFPSCLIAARWVIDSILQDVPDSPAAPQPAQFVAPAAPPQAGARLGSSVAFQGNEGQRERSAGQRSALLSRITSETTRASQVPRSVNNARSFMDTDRPPTGPDPDFKGTQAQVQAALGVSSQAQVSFLLQQSQVDIDRVVAELRNSTTELPPSERLTRGLEGQVAIHEVRPSDVEELVLDKRDQNLVQTLRHSFARLMDRRMRVHDESGTVLDPTAYLDLRMGSGDEAIFEREERGRGFSALVLLDMSGSMKPKWRTVSRACKVLAKAMKSPSSHLEVWGFTSIPSQAVMLRFMDPEKGYAPVRGVWGLTPLHIAVAVGTRRAQAMPGPTQHLFILTDGLPTHMASTTGHVAATQDLVLDVAMKVKAARSRRVNVSALVSGYEVSDEAASVMFGGRRFWTRVEQDEEDLFTGLVGLVQRAFVNHLRRA